MLAYALLLIGGLTLTRLLFEWRFPEWLWLGRPLPVMAVATAIALMGGIAGRRLWRTPGGALALTPLAINLLYLAQPAVDPAFSRVLAGGTLWLVVVLLIWQAIPAAADERWRWLGPLLVAAALLPVYLMTMSRAVGEADTFEFQVVAPQLGTAHPTGYPLYLLLGKLFSLLPVGTVAWRVNLASAIFALGAAIILFWLARRLTGQPLAALAGAVAWGLAPVVWSQAIVAEVYTLHSLIVAAALWLMVSLSTGEALGRDRRRRLALALAFTLGLGLTNHLTTVFLIPPALFVAVMNWLDRRSANEPTPMIDWRFVLMLAGAFLLPLLLYLYLPFRWQAVNGEPMGLGRFVDWVAGGRFQGALQWLGWLRDPARYGIVGRLILDNWGWFYLVLAAAGIIYLWFAQRRAAIILLLTALGFTFYALNYYVPDLAVFLLPTHVVLAVWVAAGIAAVISWLARIPTLDRWPRGLLAGLVFLLAASPLVWQTASRWSARDQSGRDGGETWARGVLSRPLAPGGAILADSEKIAPLYYVQQIEGLRPDLDIMVLPDEAAYRAELDGRVATGQAVYLARYLPNLAGAYHLRSAGPLVQADALPVAALPADATVLNQAVGPVRLLGYRADPAAAEDPAAAGVTLYWTLDRPLAAGEALPVIYVRWASDAIALVPQTVDGRHAAGDSYPINAWRPGEVVADYHALPYPAANCPAENNGCDVEVQVALGPRFAQRETLEWVSVTRLPLIAPAAPATGQPVRAQLGTALLNGVAYAPQTRPATPLTVSLSGWTGDSTPVISLQPPDALPQPDDPLSLPMPATAEGPPRMVITQVTTDVPPGTYALWAEPMPRSGSRCGWLAPISAGCVVGEVTVSGVPLPEGATNFADQVALLAVELPQTELQPGGQLPVTVVWQGLAPMTENYTIFVQVLDAQDRLVGQVDAWPVQGTFPTSQWQPGETVRDPYVIQLSDDLPPGEYKLNIGLYLLGTLQRLPVLGASGSAVNDKLEVGGLAVIP